MIQYADQLDWLITFLIIYYLILISLFNKCIALAMHQRENCFININSFISHNNAIKSLFPPYYR